jgi:hypothetical protein
MHRLRASCHCQNLVLELELTRPPATYAPRACDCDFCTKHGATYLADPAGSLVIHVTDPRLLRRYEQGSGTARCLVCAGCGVLVGAAYETDEGTWAVVNSRAVDGGVGFADPVPVSPKTLGVEQKIARWRELWFSRVTLRD